MKVQFEEKDVVVAVSAYGQSVVRLFEIDSDRDRPVYVFVDTNSDDNLEVQWRGTVESCLLKMAEAMEVVLGTDVLWMQPNSEINELIERV